jgi:hypothetical protein
MRGRSSDRFGERWRTALGRQWPTQTCQSGLPKAARRSAQWSRVSRLPAANQPFVGSGSQEEAALVVESCCVPMTARRTPPVEDSDTFAAPLGQGLRPVVNTIRNRTCPERIRW